VNESVKQHISRSKRVLFSAVLLLVGTVLCLSVVEVTVRLFLPTSDFLWQWDSRIGLKLVPGLHGRSVKRGLFDIDVDVNSVGFRDREHVIGKPPDTKRVVLLGDSFVEAIQVPFQSSVTAQLQHRLDLTTNKAEVINFGVSGTGTARQYLALREYGLKYQPDVVLVFFVGNDVSDNSRRLRSLSYVPYPQTTRDGDLIFDESGQPVFTRFADESSRFGALTDLLKSHSKTYRLLREGVDNTPALERVFHSFRGGAVPEASTKAPDNLGFYEIYRVVQKPDWEDAWRVSEHLLIALRDLAESHGAKFAVILVPGAWEVYSDLWDEVVTTMPGMRDVSLDRDQPSKRLGEFLNKNRITVISLLPEFRKRAPTLPPLYFRGDGHWTAEGHKLAADLVIDQVSAMLNGSVDSKVVRRESTSPIH